MPHRVQVTPLRQRVSARVVRVVCRRPTLRRSRMRCCAAPLAQTRVRMQQRVVARVWARKSCAKRLPLPQQLLLRLQRQLAVMQTWRWTHATWLPLPALVRVLRASRLRPTRVAERSRHKAKIARRVGVCVRSSFLRTHVFVARCTTMHVPLPVSIFFSCCTAQCTQPRTRTHVVGYAHVRTCVTAADGGGTHHVPSK